MTKPVEARIIITRGQREDLRASIDVFDPYLNKHKRLGITAGPSQASIDAEVRKVKTQLERAGKRVSVKEI